MTNSSFFLRPGLRFLRFFFLRRRLSRDWWALCASPCSFPCSWSWSCSVSSAVGAPSEARLAGSPAGAGELGEGSLLIVALYSSSGRHEPTIDSALTQRELKCCRSWVN